MLQVGLTPKKSQLWLLKRQKQGLEVIWSKGTVLLPGLFFFLIITVNSTDVSILVSLETVVIVKDKEELDFLLQKWGFSKRF